MADKLMKTTVKFSHPFRLPGVPGVLPAGAYPIEWEQRFLDDIALPEAPATPVRIHLGTGEAAAVVTVPWIDLRTALADDRKPAPRPGKVPVGALTQDPLIRLVMASDGVSDHALRRALRAARMRRAGRAALAGGMGTGRPHVHAHHPAPGHPGTGERFIMPV